MFSITLKNVFDVQNAGKINEEWRHSQHGKLSQSFTSFTLLFPTVFYTLLLWIVSVFQISLALTHIFDKSLQQYVALFCICLTYHVSYIKLPKIGYIIRIKKMKDLFQT